MLIENLMVKKLNGWVYPVHTRDHGRT